jgi:GNAT superfamily N-acetyltransferase
MELVSNYKNNDLLRQSFNELCKKIFGISFEGWYQKGLWKDNYICYSYRDGDKIVSNVSVTKMRLKENGKERKLLQIGTVMTAEDYRGQGLAKRLMEYVTKKYEDEYEVFYLFANQSVLEFYPKFGYEEIERFQLFTRDKIKRAPIYQFRKLDMDNSDDIDILTKIAENRIPTSNRFFFEGNEEILYWYCLEIFKDSIYYNEEQDLILIYTIDGDTLNLYDVISSKEIDYKKVLKSIQEDEIKETVFHFNLEVDDLNIESRRFDSVDEDDYMFVKGKLSMDGLVYPITSHT